MNKHMLCVLTIILSGNVTHAFVSEPFKEQPKKLLEYIVYEKPRQWSLMKELHRLIPAGITAGVIGKVAHDMIYKSLKAYDLEYGFYDHGNSFMATAMSSYIVFFSYIILYCTIDSTLRRKEDLDIMIDFVKEWPQHKENMPQSFHATFDNLYEIYQQEGASSHFKKQVREAITIMKFMLEEYHKQERKIDAERRTEQTNTTYQYKYIKSETVA